MFDLVGGNPDFVAGGSEPGLINNGDGRAYGVEVMLRHRPSRGPHGWLAYTLSRSERFDTATRTRGGPCLRWIRRIFYPRLWATRSWLVAWDDGSLDHGNPTTPAWRLLRCRRPLCRPLRGERRSDRLPDFFQMDLRLEKKSSRSGTRLSGTSTCSTSPTAKTSSSTSISMTSALLGDPGVPSSSLESSGHGEVVRTGVAADERRTVYELESEGDIYRPRVLAMKISRPSAIGDTSGDPAGGTAGGF